MILIQLLLSSMASQGTRDGLAGSVEKGFKDLWEEELKEPGALAYYEKWVRQTYTMVPKSLKLFLFFSCIAVVLMERTTMLP